MPDLYLLSKQAAQRVAAAEDRLAHEPWSAQKQQDRSRGRVAPVQAYLAKTTAAVAAFDGTTASSGSVDAYRVKPDGTVYATGGKETVYNLAGAVADNTWVMISRDAFGTWFFIVEKC